MTATLPPLGPTADTWDHADVVDLIAAGSDWPDKLAERWNRLVAAPAHDLAHPKPIGGCPGCPQVGECGRCGFPLLVCEDPVGHDRLWREGEASLLTGVATYRGGSVHQRRSDIDE